MKIVWMDAAIDDVERLHAFLEEKAPFAARRIRAALLRAGEGLRVFPERGRSGPSAGTRELVAGDYLLVYRLASEDALHILRVFHGKERR
jgi:toxin ParE1/3/4